MGVRVIQITIWDLKDLSDIHRQITLKSFKSQIMIFIPRTPIDLIVI